jgi:hypothetical protein
MKKISFIIILSLVFPFCFGQDVITRKNNRQLTVKVVEQTGKVVKYYMNDYTGGPILTMNLMRVSSIKYANGTVDYAGNQNPRRNRPFGISTGIAYGMINDIGYFLTTADYFVIPQLDLEANLGVDGNIGILLSAGGTAHLNSDNSDHRFTPYAGLLAGYCYLWFMVQVPVGISYISKGGFSASLRVSPTLAKRDLVMAPAELRVGWRFK